MRKLLLSMAAVAAMALAGVSTALAQGQIIVVNGDGPNEGFNDPTPAAAVGGNTGTTLGQQRLNVFNFGADVWEAVLNPANDVFVIARFNPLGAGVLGSAGTTFVFADFPGAEYPGMLYHSALADQLAGAELNPGFADIVATLSSDTAFYLGFDNNDESVAGTVHLLPVVLHELGHGLGFANFVDDQTGELFAGLPDTPPDDLTTSLFTDIGWFSDADGVPDGTDSCIGSDLRPTAFIDSCDTRTENDLFANGCTIADELFNCEQDFGNHPVKYLACVALRTEKWARDRVISRQNQAKIPVCALKGLH